MSDKELLRLWTKLCLRKRLMPICLVCGTNDGEPHVFTRLDSETMDKIYRHLIESGAIDEQGHLENQEN